tara:strand:+ start:711 stop:1217 length:507 start_codon:yes stop_codon:yes gene_type:complete
MLEQIYTYVNGVLKIDIKENTRQREYAEGRALFYKLSQEMTGNGLVSIGNYMGRTHATVLHGIKNIFPIIDSNIIVNAYKHFKSTESLPTDFFTSLQIENKRLKQELEVNKVILKNLPKLKNLPLLINELTDQQFQGLSDRIESIIYMELKKKVWTPKNIELEGAIKK